MKQMIVTLILIAVIIGLISAVVLGSNKKDKLIAEHNIVETQIDILYWGTTCPHCHETIEWIEKNNIDEKLLIIRKEVYNNQANSTELTLNAKSCGIDEMNIGVPLMYTSEGKCLIGTPEITGYLEQKVNQETKLLENDSATISDDASVSASTQEGGQ